MSKLKTPLEQSDPTIVVHLTKAGLKIELVGWQHNAPVTLLAALDVTVQRAIHQWRARFLSRQTEFGTPNVRERDLADEQQAQQRRAS